MNKKLFITYEELDSEIKRLEAKKDFIKEQCLEEMLSGDIKRVESNSGTFSLVERKTWEYSSKIKKEEERIRSLKKVEEEKGIAKVTINNLLRYQPVKI